MLQVPPWQVIYCLPCAIWKQSGGDTHFQQFHPIDDSRHAGSETLSFSLYTSFENITFDLGNNKYVCEPYYRDYTWNKHNRENIIPRWAKLKHDYYAQQLNNTKLLLWYIVCVSVNIQKSKKKKKKLRWA